MQQLFKRLLSLLLAAAVLLSLTVTALAADDGADAALTAADYAAADALFNALEDVEQTAARRDASADGRTQAICDYLNAQDAVVPGSVETSGERITWMTEQGIACDYSPRLEQNAAAAEPPAAAPPPLPARASLSIPALTAGGWSSFSMAMAAPSSGIMPMCSTMMASALRGSLVHSHRPTPPSV